LISFKVGIVLILVAKAIVHKNRSTV